MSSEEKPPSDLESESHVSPVADPFEAALVPTANIELEPVEASLAGDVSIEPEIIDSEIVVVDSPSTSISYPFGSDPSLHSPPASARNFENLAAKGGAVGALVLGIWCFAGSFITNWSMINGLIGLMMGFWGLTSKNKKMAWIGIALCLAGMFLSLVQVSDLVNTYLNARDENSF